MVKATTEERFWAKVQKTEICWLWTAGCDQDGYGIFALAHRKSVKAHRFAYELLVGPIPDGLPLDHLCHNVDRSCPGGSACQHRRCVNPAHMGPATSRENTLRGKTPAAMNAAKTRCPRGHPYEGANLMGGQGRRDCRTCRNDRQREAQRARRAERRFA